MRRLVSMLAVVVLALTGCGQDTTDEAGAGAAEPDPGAPASYDFVGTTLDGGDFEGSELAGTPAVLWFWAPWCPTCRAQIPTVTRLADQYDGKVAVVAVGGLDSEDAIRELATEIPYVTHLIDDEGEVWRHFNVTEQSTFTVIGADGAIESEGYLADDELTRLVAQLGA